MASLLYSETQRSRQIWLWVLMIGILALFFWVFIQQIILGRPWGDDPMPDVLLIFILVIPVAVNLLFFFSKLETRLDETGIHYRYFPFHLKMKTVKWEDLERVYVRKYQPILEYGGWGLRVGMFRKGSAINVSGNMGLQLVFKGGRKMLIGTNNPDELRAAARKFAEKKNLLGDPS